MKRGFFKRYEIELTVLAVLGFGILSVARSIDYFNGEGNAKGFSALLFGIVAIIKIFELVSMIRKRNLEKNNSEAL